VTDNGSGMTEEVKRRAFDMFFTTKPRGLGTGMGLALVRKVVDRAGGSVRIDSELGKGTTVVMIFPAAESAEDRGQQRIAAVRIRDGRAASLVRSLLEASGAKAGGGDDLQSADILVMEASSTSLAEAKSWRSEHRQGRLVLFGRPDRRTATAWRALQPLTIDDPDDFDAVRAALGHAMATP
jgi:hypothetical protein